MKKLIPLLMTAALVSCAPHSEPQWRGDPIGDSAFQPATVARWERIAIVSVAEDQRASYLNTTGSTRMEIGSLAKIMTADLFEQAIVAGEVNRNSTVGRFVAVEAPIADVTLEELAQHTSGLAEHPYPGHPVSEEELLDLVNSDPLATRGEYVYSNAGYALLGLALAHAAGLEYDRLLASRITRPAGMARTFIPTESTRNLPVGRTEDGRRTDSWVLGAYAPTGGIISTPEDMSNYIYHLRSRATDPPLDGIYFGMNASEDGLSKTGQTGGFESSLELLPTGEATLVMCTRGCEVGMNDATD